MVFPLSEISAVSYGYTVFSGRMHGSSDWAGCDICQRTVVVRVYVRLPLSGCEGFCLVQVGQHTPTTSPQHHAAQQAARFEASAASFVDVVAVWGCGYRGAALVLSRLGLAAAEGSIGVLPQASVEIHGD